MSAISARVRAPGDTDVNRPTDRALWHLAPAYFSCTGKGEGKHAEWCPGYQGKCDNLSG